MIEQLKLVEVELHTVVHGLTAINQTHLKFRRKFESLYTAWVRREESQYQTVATALQNAREILEKVADIKGGG